MNLLFPITEIVLEEVDSTNSFLSEKIGSKNEWTVVTAIEQRCGKGYGKSQWKSDKGKNLTFSIFIRPKCSVDMIFCLNKAVINALHKSICSIITCQIKWPNDLIINNRKAGGILVENNLGHLVNSSIIGIGLNINQTDFKNLSKATSLKKETGKDFEPDSIRYKIIANFQREYQLFKEGKFDVISHYFDKYLYRKNKISVFKIENQLKNGIIKKTEKGKLLVEIEGEDYKSFNTKEIELLY